MPRKKIVLGSVNVSDLAEPQISTPTKTRTSPASHRATLRHSGCRPSSPLVIAVVSPDGRVASSEVTVRALSRLQRPRHTKRQPAVESDGGEQQRAGDRLIPE